MISVPRNRVEIRKHGSAKLMGEQLSFLLPRDEGCKEISGKKTLKDLYSLLFEEQRSKFTTDQIYNLCYR